MFQENKKFYDKIRNTKLKPEVLNSYNKMMKEKEQFEKDTEYFLTEKPVLDKIKRELEEERFELEKRSQIKN